MERGEVEGMDGDLDVQQQRGPRIVLFLTWNRVEYRSWINGREGMHCDALDVDEKDAFWVRYSFHHSQFALIPMPALLPS